ncbi:hypothetical protein LC147_27430, partial [Vibrio harveyi]
IVLKTIAKKLVKSHKGPAHRARVNFDLCFPEKSFKGLYCLIRLEDMAAQSCSVIKQYAEFQAYQVL